MADLATRLNIKPGSKVALLGAPAALAAALEQACPAAEFFDSLNDAPYELIFFWPTQLAGLAETFAHLQRQIVPDGAIWAVIPKQRVARRISFSWGELQAAGLQTDLVDNKIASVSDEEYATRFVIRKDRRGKYGAPSPTGCATSCTYPMQWLQATLRGICGFATKWRGYYLASKKAILTKGLHQPSTQYRLLAVVSLRNP